MNWTEWSLDRMVILFVSLAYLLIGIQVTLFHSRQNFHHKTMYTPVITAPILFAVGILYTLNRTTTLATLFVLSMIAGIAVGGFGSYLHFKGVKLRVGGPVIRNFQIGPPVVLPVVFLALGVFGLIAVLWGV